MLNPTVAVGREAASAFSFGEAARKLHLVICDTELGSSPALSLLSDLAECRDTLRVVSLSGDLGGRIEMEETPGVDDRMTIIHRFSDGEVTMPYLYGIEWAKREAPSEAKEHGLETETALRYLLLAHHCSRLEWNDGLVAGFPVSMTKRWRKMCAKAPLLTDSEALALAALYLRAHGDFTVGKEEGVCRFVRPRVFYTRAAASLLGRSEEWFLEGIDRWQGGGSPDSFALAEAVVERFARALRARDYLQVRARAGDARDAWGDALFFFEAVLLYLQGALDAAARFAQLLYEPGASRTRASWYWKDWRERIARVGDAASIRLKGEGLGSPIKRCPELRKEVALAKQHHWGIHEDGLQLKATTEDFRFKSRRIDVLG